jgi:hypothetical protein
MVAEPTCVMDQHLAEERASFAKYVTEDALVQRLFITKMRLDEITCAEDAGFFVHRRLFQVLLEQNIRKMVKIVRKSVYQLPRAEFTYSFAPWTMDTKMNILLAIHGEVSVSMDASRRKSERLIHIWLIDLK